MPLLAPRRPCFLALLLALPLLFAGPPRPASAWDATGHMVVARLAWDQLTPAAKARVTALLTHSAAFTDWTAHKPAAYPDAALYAFMHAAIWPDDIRKTPADRPAWHYIDEPVTFPHTAFASGGIVPPPPVMPNAETELANQIYVLSLATAAPEDRAASLCWVEHLVGDLHQPLHCVSMYLSLFPHGDQGGNSILLSIVPRIPDVAGIPAFPQTSLFALIHPPAPDAPYTPRPPHNLHALWDDLLGSTRSPADIDRIAASLQTPAYARSSFPQIRAHANIPEWVMEGRALASQSVYLNGTITLVPSPDASADSNHPHAVTTLPLGYVVDAQAIAKRQIVLAAYRLADTLNAVLGQ